MKTYKPNKNTLLACAFLIIVVALITIPRQSDSKSRISETQVNVQGKTKETDNYDGSLVEYDAKPKTSQVDPQQQILRQARSNRYNNRAPEPLGDFVSIGFEINTDWNIGLQPLPIAQSDVVILGKVIDAQAYLSSDKAGTYSEFTINVEKIFKNTEPPISKSLVLEREGGVVKFATGRLLPYKIVGQRLPRIQREYVFFLKHNAQGDDYHIITAYGIYKDRILPLDEPQKFQVFNDMRAEQFFKTLQDEMAK